MGSSVTSKHNLLERFTILRNANALPERLKHRNLIHYAATDQYELDQAFDAFVAKGGLHGVEEVPSINSEPVRVEATPGVDGDGAGPGPSGGRADSASEDLKGEISIPQSPVDVDDNASQTDGE